MTFAMELRERFDDGRIEGRIEGKAEDIIALLEDIGIPSDSLQNIIMSETDVDLLKKWLKLAAKSQTIEEFEAKAGLERLFS